MTASRLIGALAAAGVLCGVALLATGGGPDAGGVDLARDPDGAAAPSAAAEPEPPRADPAPTPALAERTLDRFERFRSGEAGDRLALGGPELSALARYALLGLFPPGVIEPAIRIHGDRIDARARVVLADFPALPGTVPVQAILPDTVAVEVRGWLGPLDEHRLALTVERVAVAGVPLPRAVVPEVLAALGREAVEGLPVDALAVPRPNGLLAVVVRRDSLVLVAPGARGSVAVVEESG